MDAVGVSNVLIVASSAAARSELIGLCAVLEHVRVIGEVNSGTRALETAEILRPDLVLLDTPLTDMTGRDLVWRMPAPCRHAVVMVTANPQEIPLSLETGAAECLSRPLSAPAVLTALTRAQARARTTLHENADLRRTQIRQGSLGAHDPLVLVGEREHRLYPFDPHKVDYIESADNYVKFHLGNLEYISRDTVKRLHPLLRPLGFVRIERSLLLNIVAIAYVQPVGHGVFVFALASGQRLHSSPTYLESILDVLPLRRRTSARRSSARDRSK